MSLLLFILVYSQVTEVISDLIVVVGNDTSIPCNIHPPNPDDSLKAVMWYNVKSDNPIYTIDARTNQTDKWKHFASEVLKNRAFVNFSYPISYLHIRPVEERDDGEYRCRVDFKRGRTKYYSTKLQVIGQLPAFP